MSLHSLNHYARRFQSVKRANGKAPHKLVLLLSIIDLIDHQSMPENRIPLDATLNQLFRDNWQKFNITDYKPTITNPIYYLQSDGFWQAYDKNGNRITTRTALSNLSAGKFDEELFQLLQSNELRPLLRMVLLDMLKVSSNLMSVSLPTADRVTADYIFADQLPNYIHDIEAEILEGRQDPRRTYTRTTERFVRSHKFRHHLMHLYKHTCCISGLQTIPDFGLIEAAHIRDHALTGDSTLQNGIPLCKNLHYAFDSGIISLNNQHQVIGKNKKEFQESDSVYNIRQFIGTTIRLPDNERYYPALQNLKRHREKWKFNN